VRQQIRPHGVNPSESLEKIPPMPEVNPGSSAPGALPRAALWLLLSIWIGGWFVFAFGVTTTAFRVLPTDQAGAVVGPILRGLHLYAAVAGVLLAGLAVWLRRGRAAVLLPLLLAGLCLVSELVVTGRIAALRAHAGAGVVGVESFHALHRISMGIYTAVGIGTLVLLWLHVRADTPRPGAR
jgi:hypothetical protein